MSVSSVRGEAIDDPSNVLGVQEQRDDYGAKFKKLISNVCFLREHNPERLLELEVTVSSIAADDSGIDLAAPLAKLALDVPERVDTDEVDESVLEVAASAVLSPEAQFDQAALKVIKAFKAKLDIQETEGDAPNILKGISFNKAIFETVHAAAVDTAKTTPKVGDPRLGRTTMLVQHELKELSAKNGSLRLDALTDPHLPKPSKATARIIDKFRAIPAEKLIADMTPLATALGARYTYTAVDGVLVPTKIPSGVPYDTAPGYASATVAIINGNNDLTQVENACKEIRKHPNKASMHVYISGFGGHGTMIGPIPGKTEAETMGRHAFNMLVDSGIDPAHIHLETHATNSGENVGFLNAMIHETQPEARDFLMFGTHAAVARQAITLAGQSQLININSITTLPTEHWVSTYFSDVSYPDRNGSIVYSLCLLREALSLTMYDLTTKYLAACERVEPEAFKATLAKSLEYYELLANPAEKLTEEQKRLAIDGYMQFVTEKVEAGREAHSYVVDQEVVDALKAQYASAIAVFKPVNDFFRNSFGEFETLFMPRLPRDISAHDQTKEFVKAAAGLQVQAQSTYF